MENTQLIPLSCDDSYFSLLLNNEETLNQENDENLMSDSTYAEELQLQEAIAASLINGHNMTLRVVCFSSHEIGSSSSSDEFSAESSRTVCEICAETKDRNEIFPADQSICTHRFCHTCISKHISIRIQKSKVDSIINSEAAHFFTCPGLDCQGLIEIEKCREILSGDVIAMWDQMICESSIDPSQKYYCPYRDCSTLLVNEGNGDEAFLSMREAECPYCKRLFCAKCKVPWHYDVGSCEEFMSLNDDEKGRDDILVHKLAKVKKWQRCPSCKFFVEKNEGCLHISCRCGHEFCYACGKTWSSTHGGCQQ